MAKPTYDQTFRILILGDSSVGKTCILKRFADDEFTTNFLPTIGVDFKIKSIKIDDKIIKLQIWDTAGQERFSKITESFYRGAKGVFFVYDITNGKSFDNISRWLRNFDENIEEDVVKFLIGNKCDLKDLRVIAYDKGLTLANKFGFPFYETSAKDNININKIFNEMARYLSDKNTINQPSTKNITLESDNSNLQSYFKMNSFCCQ